MLPAEAVTLVRELALQVTREDLPGVPSAHVVRLGRDGRLFIEGPVAADDRAVVRAAHLLERVLPGFDAPAELRVPGALRLVIARALGTLDLPPYPSLHEFVAALDRFALPDAAAVVRSLYAARAATLAETGEIPALPAETMATLDFTASPGFDVPLATDRSFDQALNDGELTVSDIRRARRATGLTLGEVSNRSRIPVWLLRELEWGYLRNWPAGHHGRTQLMRYARATGLDDGIVVGTLWPMLQADGNDDVAEVTVTTPGAEPSTALAVLPTPFDHAPSAPQATWSRTRVLAALAIPALLAIGIAPAMWERSPAEPAADAPAAAAPAPAVERTPMPPASRGAAPAPAVPVETRAKAPAPVLTRAEVRPHPLPEQTPYSPAFSAVGSAMFFHTEANGRSALMRADTDSRGAVLRITSVVDDRAQNYHARPSPDGTLIAFDSDREGTRAVYVADANGRNVRRVSGEGFAAIPSWSPDGQSLAYIRAEPDEPRVWNLWTSSLETGRERRLTSHRYGQPWGGSWFPDGKRIAYSHEDRLLILDMASGRERIFKSPLRGRLVRTPAVSPDGKRVIFQVSRDGTWLLDVADGEMRKVLSDPSAEEYTWAPDGRRVAYHSRRTGDWGVWVMASR